MRFGVQASRDWRFRRRFRSVAGGLMRFGVQMGRDWRFRRRSVSRRVASALMRFGVQAGGGWRFGRRSMSRVGAGRSRQPALPEVSAPYDHSLAAILGVGGETLADFHGAIAAFLGELVSERGNVASQIPHERRRLIALRRLSSLAILPASNLFARELIHKRFHLALAQAVDGDRLPLVRAGRRYPRRLQTPQHRVDFGV
jgi:hypothetical protein